MLDHTKAHAAFSLGHLTKIIDITRAGFFDECPYIESDDFSDTMQ